VNYRIEVGRDKALSVLVSDHLSDQASLSLPELADGQYWVRVRGIDANGLEGKSRTIAVLLDTQPQPPLSLNPPDNAVLRGTVPELEWTKTEGVDSYLLEIAKDTGFEQIVHRVPDLQISHYRPQEISEPGVYYWRVTSILQDEMGPPGVVRSWQAKPNLDAVESTISSTDEKVTASWVEAGEGYQYQVQMALDADFETIELDQHLTASQITFDQRNGQARYLRVRVIDTDGYTGPWGSVQYIEPTLDQDVWAVPILFVLGIFFI
jgi:hypothetical protein